LGKELVDVYRTIYDTCPHSFLFMILVLGCGYFVVSHDETSQISASDVCCPVYFLIFIDTNKQEKGMLIRSLKFEHTLEYLVLIGPTSRERRRVSLSSGCFAVVASELEIYKDL
jgi:hypothetical protein